MKNQKSKYTRTNTYKTLISTKPFFSKDDKESFFSKGDFIKPTVQMNKNKDLPETVQIQMESFFNEDLSNVKIHKNSRKAKVLNAQAFTEGNNIHFANGKHNTTTKEGKTLIGHELTHVVQQRTGRANTSLQFNGLRYNTEGHLENEAKIIGEKVANESDQIDGTLREHVYQPHVNTLQGKSIVQQRKCSACNQNKKESELQESRNVIQLSGNEQGFFDHFNQCTDDLGLLTPSSLFGSFGTATATLRAINTGIRTFGSTVTIGELIGAGVLSEALIALAALTASYYAAACVQCLANAAGQSLSGGYSLGDGVYDLVQDIDESRYTEQRGVVRRGIRRE